MGSVQSDIVCPKCKWKSAMEDFYYKSNEVFIHCGRCGYSYERWVVIDKAKGKRIKTQVMKLIKGGKLNEAIKEDYQEGWTRSTTNEKGERVEISIMDWSDEEKIKHLQQVDFSRYYKKDKKGHLVYKRRGSGGHGCYTYGKGGINSVGSLKKGGLKGFIHAVENNIKEYDVLEATFKRKEEWFKLNIKTGEEDLMVDDYHVEVKE